MENIKPNIQSVQKQWHFNLSVVVKGLSDVVSGFDQQNEASRVTENERDERGIQLKRNRKGPSWINEEWSEKERKQRKGYANGGEHYDLPLYLIPDRRIDPSLPVL